MARYSVEITDGNGNPLEDYTATIVHHSAPNKVAESKPVKPTPGVPTSLEIDPRYTGNTLLYIMGPVPGSDQDAGENLSHFEPINLDHDGSFTFVIFHCPDSNTKPTAAAAAASLPEDMTSILEKTEGTAPAVLTSHPKVVELVCTPVRLHASRTVAPPYGYVCELQHHDMPRALTVPVHVAPGADVTLQVPSAQGAYFCHVYEADAAGGKGALLGSLRLTLRVGDRPYGATLLLTPAKPCPEQHIPTKHYAHVPMPAEIEYLYYGNHKDPALITYDSRFGGYEAMKASARADKIWQIAHKDGQDWLDKEHPDALESRVVACFDNRHGYFTIIMHGGTKSWNARRFALGPGHAIEGYITFDVIAHSVLVEWTE